MTTVIALYFYKRVSLKDGIFILTRGGFYPNTWKKKNNSNINFILFIKKKHINIQIFNKNTIKKNKKK